MRLPAEGLPGQVVAGREVERLRRELDRLQALASRDRKRLRRLQALAAALSEAVTPGDVAGAALHHVAAALGARDGGVWLMRERGVAELLQHLGFSRAAQARLASVAPGGGSPVAEVLRDAEPIWCASLAELLGRYPGLSDRLPGAGALACLPLQVKGRCLGAAAFTVPADHAFSRDDRAYLLVAARAVAQALERARLFEAEQLARAEAVAVGARSAFLSEASAVLASSLEYQTTLSRVAQLAVPRVADWCAVDLAEDLAAGRPAVVMAHADPAKAELARELNRRFPPDPAALHGPPAVLRSGRPELHAEIPDALLAAVARHPDQLRIARELGLRSAMVVPMIARGRTLGVITLVAAESGRGYGPPDLEMAEHLARRAALAIDNARLYRQAQEAAQAREQVVAVVAHDLKNPLNAILMSSGLLRRTAGDPERVRHHADAIDRAVLRMRDLVRDLLDLARIEAGRFVIEAQAHDAAALVGEALALLQPLAQAKGLRLEAEPPPAAGGQVWCDRARVLQVLSNLVGNAIAYTPAGGRITVRCALAPDGLTFAVADTGPGIPPEQQRLVFERFWTAHGAGQGSGLGLSIARGVVEAHGGRIWVESAPGRGAVFTFTLPRTPGGRSCPRA